MQPSQACIDLVKSSEGLRLQAYRDSAGVITIGYGHTGGVSMGDSITQEQADTFLIDDLDDAAESVAKLVTVPLTQGQFDALTSFTFNLGASRLMNSTLLRVLNRADYSAAAAQFKFWVMGGGVVLPGLVKRRLAERDLFEANA